MSVAKRFVFSAGNSFVRLFIGSFLGFLIARQLGPSDFGDYSFLLAVMTSFVAFIDLKYSQAFFTFSSSGAANSHNFKILVIWYALQLAVVLLILFLAGSLVKEKIFKVSDEGIILLAFLAVFIQQRIWNGVAYLFELIRETYTYQLVFSTILLVHAILVIVLIIRGDLGISSIFISIIISWSAGILFVLSKSNCRKNILVCLNQNEYSTFGEYGKYCAPLLPFAILIMINDIVDRSVIQFMGGSIEQGYYSLSKQISLLALVATTSILNTLWRELSYHYSNNNFRQFKELIKNTVLVLYCLAALTSCGIIPWSKEILNYCFGDQYIGASGTFSIMLLYPIHQVLGQISGIILLSISRTKIQMYSALLCVFLNLSGVAIIYFMDSTGSQTSFLYAIKMTVIQVITVNALLLYILKRLDIVVIGVSQLLIPGMLLLLSFSIKFVVVGMIDAPITLVISCLLYLGIFIFVAFRWPVLLGMDVNIIARGYNLLVSKGKESKSE